jgi:hypothetical protein
MSLGLGLGFFLFSSFCLVASTAFSCKIFFFQEAPQNTKTGNREGKENLTRKCSGNNKQK